MDRNIASEILEGLDDAAAYMDGLPTNVRVNHEKMAGKIVITSPDVKGLHVVADTNDAAEAKLQDALKYIGSVRGCAYSVLDEKE